MRKTMKTFRVLILFVWLVLSLGVSFGQGRMTPQQQELAAYVKNNYAKREVMIPMRDGVKLFTAIYEPKDTSQKYPIMFDRTPYSVSPYGAALYKISLGPNELFPREGYIFVYQGVRGCWMSVGEFENVRPYIPN